MRELTPEAITERKTRERLAFLALPPAEAQRMISLRRFGSLRDVTDPNQDLCYGLEEEAPPDEMVDK